MLKNPVEIQVALVIPVFNEEQVVQPFYTGLTAVINALPYHFRIWYVDDGSNDSTLEQLRALAARDERIHILELSRNFGHQAALTAGLDAAEGDYIIMLDGDGQHPPAMIPAMLQEALAGYDIVLTQRLEQNDVSAFKSRTSRAFYGLINRLGDTQILEGGADFRSDLPPGTVGLAQYA